MIALLGNVFSPYYAARRRQGPAEPLDHCAMNVAYYGPGGPLWALTERDRGSVERTGSRLRIAESVAKVDDDGGLTFHLCERTSPFAKYLRGTVRVEPGTVGSNEFALDDAGRHRWTPLRLNARATVQLEHPFRTAWTGRAYVDTNDGDEPLERGFRSWDWSRTSGDDLTHVVYDVTRADGSASSVRRTFRRDGTHVPLSGVEAFEVGKTRWGVGRRVPSDVGTKPRVCRSLEDTPFYARTLSTARFGGQPVHLVHETVDLQRFDRRWVQFLIPFRMRRVA